jgi:hypothetical protein
MKKFLLIIGGIFVVIAIVIIVFFEGGFYHDYLRWRDTRWMPKYYTELAGKCGRSECCIDSVKEMAFRNYMLAIENKCQKSYVLKTLAGCAESYKWCEKIESMIIIILEHSISRELAEEIAVAAHATVGLWSQESTMLNILVNDVETKEDISAAMERLKYANFPIEYAYQPGPVIN